MKDLENIHSGHRLRLTRTVDKCGLENLSEIQVLEFVLFYIFPRGDVNPLSHRLLDKYKTLANVLEASVDDLKQVKGMGEMSAMKLHSILYVFDIYMAQKATQSLTVASIGDIYDLVEALLRFKSEERLVIIGLSKRSEFLGYEVIAKGNYDNIILDQRDISNFCNKTKSKAVVMAHNHPQGKAIPSQADTDTNRELFRKFEFGGVELLDNLIIGTDGIFSMKDNKLKRSFSFDDRQLIFSFNQ